MPQDPQSDQDFLKANPREQHAYLAATDPDYAKAPATEQSAYLQHLSQPSEPSTYDKLTSSTDPGAESFDKVHPVMGKGIRALSAAGGAVMGLPGSIYHAFADPETDEEKSDFQNSGHTEIPGELTLERLTGARQMVQAGKDYAGGKVSPSAAMSVAPEALGQGAGITAGAELGGAAMRGVSKFPLMQGLRTAGKVIANEDLTKPFKSASKIPDYWRDSSPEMVRHRGEMNDPMTVATKNAIKEKRALPIRMRNPGAAGSMAESVNPDAIPGSAARGFGRMVLTPEESMIEARNLQMAQRMARQRGMQFAGGMVPAEGRAVPMRPRPTMTEEWRGVKPESEQ